MPHPGPRRAAPPAVALCLLGLALLAAIPASASAQGYTCEASALAATLGPSPRTEPITANKSASPAVQGGLRRRQPARVAAADHRQPAVGDDRPPAALRLAVRADRDRRRRRRRAADRRPADPARASRHERPARSADDRARRGTIDVRAAVEALVPETLQRRAAEPARAARPGHRPLRQRLAAADGHLVGAGDQRARQGAARRPRRVADRDASWTHRASTRRTSARSQLGSRASRSTRPMQAIARRHPDDLDPGDRGAAEGHAGPQDRGRRQAHPARARPHADRRRAERRRPHGGRGDRRRRAGQLRRRRRPRAAVHLAADRADRRPALQGPREAARRRQPPLRRQARDDPLHGHGQGRGAAAWSAAPACSPPPRSCRGRGSGPPTGRATRPRSPRRRACGSSSCGGCSCRARRSRAARSRSPAGSCARSARRSSR